MNVIVPLSAPMLIAWPRALAFCAGFYLRQCAADRLAVGFEFEGGNLTSLVWGHSGTRQEVDPLQLLRASEVHRRAAAVMAGEFQGASASSGLPWYSLPNDASLTVDLSRWDKAAAPWQQMASGQLLSAILDRTQRVFRAFEGQESRLQSMDSTVKPLPLSTVGLALHERSLSMPLPFTPYEKINDLLLEMADRVGEAVCLHHQTRNVTEQIGQALHMPGVLARGQLTRLKDLHAADRFVRSEALDGLEALNAGIDREIVRNSLTGNFSRAIKNDLQNPLPVFSVAFLEFMLAHLDREDPYRPNGERGNGNRPYHQDHMVPGSIVTTSIPFLIADGTFTAGTPRGQFAKWVMARYGMARVLRRENERLDRMVEGHNLASSYPPNGDRSATARARFRDIPLAVIDPEQLVGLGWSPLSDIVKVEKAVAGLIRRDGRQGLIEAIVV